MSRQYHNLNRLYNALQRTQVPTLKLKPGPLIGQSIKFQAFAPELCPRPTEEHAPTKPLSGIEHLMESHAAPLLVLPHSKLVENAVRYLQSKIDTEKCGRDWLCSQNLISSPTQTKFYKSQNQYFLTDNITMLE